MQDYQLIDSGDGEKLEKFGPYLLVRPCAQAVWRKQLPSKNWQNADALFTREPSNSWTFNRPLPESWTIEVSGINFKISLTDFGHLGIFPEQANFWSWIQSKVKSSLKQRSKVRVLNLFAYSGGSSLAAAKAGAEVCHLDAAKGMVSWARENAALSGLEAAPVRWIVEDVRKFLKRELNRGSFYDAIILDPPTFGRGAKGELFKIELEINNLLDLSRSLLTKNPLFVLFSCHSPGFTPIGMSQLLKPFQDKFSGSIDKGEMTIGDINKTFQIPSGSFARWSCHDFKNN